MDPDRQQVGCSPGPVHNNGRSSSGPEHPRSDPAAGAGAGAALCPRCCHPAGLQHDQHRHQGACTARCSTEPARGAGVVPRLSQAHPGGHERRHAVALQLCWVKGGQYIRGRLCAADQSARRGATNSSRLLSQGRCVCVCVWTAPADSSTCGGTQQHQIQIPCSARGPCPHETVLLSSAACGACMPLQLLACTAGCVHLAASCFSPLPTPTLCMTSVCPQGSAHTHSACQCVLFPTATHRCLQPAVCLQACS